MIKHIITLSLAMLIFVTGAWTQEGAKTDKEEQESERKKAEESQRASNYEAILELLEDRNFVIEAYQFRDRYGQMVQVNTTTNFIAVRDSVATVQIVFPGSVSGYNGLGGITLDGRLTSLEINEKDPGKGVRFHMRVFGSGFASADMFVDVGTDGRAILRYNGLQGSRFTLQGYFQSWAGSGLFKGSPLY